MRTRFYGSLSVYSRPLPSEKNSPFAAQLKIAFRRFLLHVIRALNVRILSHVFVSTTLRKKNHDHAKF